MQHLETRSLWISVNKGLVKWTAHEKLAHEKVIEVNTHFFTTRKQFIYCWTKNQVRKKHHFFFLQGNPVPVYCSNEVFEQPAVMMQSMGWYYTTVLVSWDKQAPELGWNSLSFPSKVPVSSWKRHKEKWKMHFTVFFWALFKTQQPLSPKKIQVSVMIKVVWKPISEYKT